MDKTVFIFDLSISLSGEGQEKLRSNLAAQIKNGVLLLADGITFVAAYGAPLSEPVVIFNNCSSEAEPAERMAPETCKLVRHCESAINFAELKAIIKSGEGLNIIKPFDEIKIALDNGQGVTAVCGGYPSPTRARFVFKDCFPVSHRMNEQATNAGGYFNSEARRFVLEHILPRLPEELRKVIEPRSIVEEIAAKECKHVDALWLPSGNDVFGASGYWGAETDSPQLDIFKNDLDRIKARTEFDTRSWPGSWWLRSSYIGYSDSFVYVSLDGSCGHSTAEKVRGLAPGFDL